jgi:predicted HicB family RNase H-like nuclease
MEYKGYRGAVRYSAEDRLLHGRFHEAVDDYLELCESLGRDPDREYSGRIPLRIDAALHRRVAIAADSAAKSVNAWITDALETATEPRRSDPTGTRKRRRGARKATG